MKLGKHIGRIKWFRDMVRWRSKIAFRYGRAWFHKQLVGRKHYIGITGSAGKTTTKDIAVAILSRHGPTAGTDRSMNSIADLPYEVTAVERRHKFCVIEISVGRPGAIKWPIRLVRPEVGVLTTIGRDHYKSFKSVDAIAAEKAKLIYALPRSGTAVLNIDDERVRSIGEKAQCNRIWVGWGSDATIRILEARSEWPDPIRLRLEYAGKTFDVETRLHGRHMAYPALHALGIALAVGIDMDDAIAGLSDVEPTEGRMQIVQGEDGVTFLRDDWKAPEWSAKLSLEFLRDANAVRKVAVIGSLSDFSVDSSSKYKSFARDIGEYCDLAVFVGDNAHRAMRAKGVSKDCTLVGFSKAREASAYLRGELRAGDLVLLKGSNKADHLVRLMLDRYKRIECWAERCGRDTFCTRCSRLYVPVDGDVGTENDEVRQKEGALDARMFVESSASTVTVIVGLGNPEARERNTIHNVGQRVLELIADRQGLKWQENEMGAFGLVTLDNGKEVLLFKPAAPMNRNGEALARFLVDRKSNPDHCVIVHDDTDIEFGKVRFKRDGGDGGHKGVRSVIAALGTDRVGRVRVGVRRPDEKAGAAHRVLEPFSAAEEKAMTSVLEQAVTVMERNVGMRVEAG